MTKELLVEIEVLKTALAEAKRDGSLLVKMLSDDIASKGKELTILKQQVAELEKDKEKFSLLLKEASHEIKTYHIDWARFNSQSPDYDKNYKPEYPKIVSEIDAAITLLPKSKE